MTAYQALEVLIGIAVAILVTCLLLIAALAIRRPKMLQLEAAYRQFSPSGALPDRNRRLRLTLLVLAVLVILNVVWLGYLLSRAPGVIGRWSPPPVRLRRLADWRRAPVRHQPPTLGTVRRRRRLFGWTIWPTPPGPSKPFESKVRITVEQTPFCECSAGRKASGWPSRYPPRPTNQASSPPMSSLGSRAVTGFAC
jgi:hypothetical protein